MHNTTAQVAVMGRMKFPADRLQEALQATHTMVDATRAQDGCLLYAVTLDPLEPGVLRFSELWPDQASLTRHIAAAHVVPWRAAVKNCGILERQFTVYDITNARDA